MPGNVRDTFENLELFSYQYVLPNKETSKNTNGAWRFYVDGSGNLVFERRESGSWVEKGKWTA